MSRPSVAKAYATIDNGRGKDIRIGQVGSGPLVEIWVSEHGNGSRGIYLDLESAGRFSDALVDLLDAFDAAGLSSQETDHKGAQ